MKEKLETIRELIIRKKAFVLLTFLLVFTISGSLIYVSSAKEKASIEVSSLQTRMQDKLNEIDSLKDTISLQDEELSSLKLENQNIQASLDDYIRKDNQQKELSSTVKKLRAKNRTLIIRNQSLTKKVKKLRTKNASLNAQIDTINKSSSSTSKKPNRNTESTSEKQCEIVHVTETGTKYHRAGCSYLRQSDYEMSLSDAQREGYTPCSRCY